MLQGIRREGLVAGLWSVPATPVAFSLFGLGSHLYTLVSTGVPPYHCNKVVKCLFSRVSEKLAITIILSTEINAQNLNAVLQILI